MCHRRRATSWPAGRVITGFSRTQLSRVEPTAVVAFADSKVDRRGRLSECSISHSQLPASGWWKASQSSSIRRQTAKHSFQSLTRTSRKPVPPLPVSPPCTHTASSHFGLFAFYSLKMGVSFTVASDWPWPSVICFHTDKARWWYFGSNLVTK
jgi:hypothetical protein